MTTNKKESATAKKSRVKISKLPVNEEPVKDLTDKEAEQIKGGEAVIRKVNCGTGKAVKL